MDFIILTELSMRGDSYGSSTFVYKNKLGRLTAGPLFDLEDSLVSGASNQSIQSNQFNATINTAPLQQISSEISVITASFDHYRGTRILEILLLLVG